MNRNSMLQEMGIQVWIPKESEVKAVPAAQEPQVVDSVAAPLVTPQMTPQASSLGNAPDVRAQVISIEDNEEKASTTLEMKWTLLFDRNDAALEKLRSQVLRVIDDLGGVCQILVLDSNDLQASHIEGQVLIAFGQKMGQLVSGERDTVDHLRGILFDSQNMTGEEIPALVSYSLSDLKRAPKNKSFLWDDLLWARSVWLDSRLY